MSVTSIEWTKRPGTVGETWNPTTGCSKVDRGCKHCYAEIMHRRLQAMGQEKYKQDFLKGAVAHPETLGIPLAWKKPRTVFVDSMSDLFHVNVPFEFIHQVMEVIRQTPQHTYLVLTKRPERSWEFWRWARPCDANGIWIPPANLWMGTSANDQESANFRVPILLTLTGCSVLFLSYEPATGPVDLFGLTWTTCKTNFVLDALAGRLVNYQIGLGDDLGIELRGEVDDAYKLLSWVIAGGESGPKAVPSERAWFRKVRDDCKKAGVPFFFKQWGLYRPEPLSLDDIPRMVKSKDKGYNVLDMEIHQQFPEPLKVTT